MGHTRTSAPNVWAKLYITCPSGNKVIYDGPIASNTANFYFPLWDGKDKYGQKMPTVLAATLSAQAAAVPEPGAAGVALLSLAALALRRSRRE